MRGLGLVWPLLWVWRAESHLLLLLRGQKKLGQPKVLLKQKLGEDSGLR